jgi:flagellar biogenesis protein FliO
MNKKGILDPVTIVIMIVLIILLLIWLFTRMGG